MSKPRRMRERRTWAWLTGVAIVKPTLLALTRREWIDGDKLPADGGCIVVANHLSHIDPMTLVHFLHDHGRLARFLAKDSLFEVFFAGAILRGTGQIPVARLTADASSAYAHAVQGVRDGKAVVFYPEGTLTRDPDLWPMTGKTGAARVALETGAPVIPIAQWGQHEILYPYSKRPRLLPPRTVRLKVGDPVELDDLIDGPITPAVLREATDRIMDAITHLVADLREEQPPAVRYDPKEHGVREIGNPHARRDERAPREGEGDPPNERKAL